VNIDHLQRDAKKVHEALKETESSLLATKRCKIYVPEHYFGNFLGSVDDELRFVGIFGIVVDDLWFATSRCCAILASDPTTTNIQEINGQTYMEFTYEPGDVIIKNLNLVRISTLAFRIYDEFISKGKVPWYMGYEDMCYLMDTALYHADANLNVDSAILEMIASSMARQRQNKTIFYRHIVKSPSELGSVDYIYVPLRSVAYGATNTTAKLLGAYFQEGMTSALITPSERPETIEELLRK
jgi:hypothetical protein